VQFGRIADDAPDLISQLLQGLALLTRVMLPVTEEAAPLSLFLWLVEAGEMEGRDMPPQPRSAAAPR
jgi:hypothetical protein